MRRPWGEFNLLLVTAVIGKLAVITNMTDGSFGVDPGNLVGEGAFRKMMHFQANFLNVVHLLPGMSAVLASAS